MDTVNAKEESSSDAGTPAVNANSGNGVPNPAREQGPFAVKRDADQKAPLVGPRAITTISKKSGGPSTKQGKKKSRRNAVKHGIFAKVVLLNNEPTAQFDNLLRGIRNDLQPEGTLEEVLVEKLASLMWRYRRMLVAERAEIGIEQRHNSHAAIREAQQWKDALALEESDEVSTRGLLQNWVNPVSLQRSVDLLKSVKSFLLLRGFNSECDFQLLARVFGRMDSIPECLLYGQYELESPEAKEKYLAHLQSYIDSIENSERISNEISAPRERMERKSACVPESARLDRILRYSASLERDFDRTLNQLERLQRMRKGQPAAPTLNVNISG